MSAEYRPVFFDDQTAHQHAPRPLSVDAIDLEGDQPGTLHLLEEALADPHQHVRSLDHVVDRKYQGSAILWDAEVAVPSLCRPQR